MGNYQHRPAQRAEYVKTQPEADRYDMEVDGDVEQYIEDKRNEFYEEWMEYMMRDDED